MYFESMAYTAIETHLGWVWVASTAKGLCALSLGGEGFGAIHEAKTEAGGEGLLARVCADLQRYFAGEEVAFDYRLDLSQATGFQRSVWRVVREIPWGQVRSYRWVAERVGNPRATRAVGGALAKNPLPIIIACHRVVRSDGSLGGFSSGLGWKRGLLELEGVRVGPDFKVSFETRI